MTAKERSAMFKEAFFNADVSTGNLIIVDRITGKIQKFTLEETWTEYRLKYAPTKEELESQKDKFGDRSCNPEDIWGANGWKRMKRLEMAE